MAPWGHGLWGMARDGQVLWPQLMIPLSGLLVPELKLQYISMAMSPLNHLTIIAAVNYLLGLCCLAGCGGDRPVVVHGTVTVNGESPDSGEIRFVPIEGTGGSVNAAVIVDGAYRIDGRGGVVPGRYRVEIIAMKKTGKQVEQFDGFEMTMGEEKLLMSPPTYAGAESPLVQPIAVSDAGPFDFAIP